jgi:hypothetical protein
LDPPSPLPWIKNEGHGVPTSTRELKTLERIAGLMDSELRYEELSMIAAGIFRGERNVSCQLVRGYKGKPIPQLAPVDCEGLVSGRKI